MLLNEELRVKRQIIDIQIQAAQTDRDVPKHGSADISDTNTMQIFRQIFQGVQKKKKKKKHAKMIKYMQKSLQKRKKDLS